MAGVEAVEKRIILVANASRLELAPGIGGGIARLVLDGDDILRAAPRDAADPHELGEFPMAPWVNRIADGCFIWNARNICVADRPGADAHGLHGIVWAAPWDVQAVTHAEAVLGQVWSGGPAWPHAEAVLGQVWSGGPAWPFAFAMTRRFVLSSHALEIEASLVNIGEEAMPAALGFHPYFPSRNARLRADVTGGWMTLNSLPHEMGCEDAASRICAGAGPEEAPLDNCLVGWNGEAVISWRTHAVRLTTEPRLQHLQVYTPAGANFFCVEPQTAMPDAFNRKNPESGTVTLLPGASLRVLLRLELCPSL